MLETLLQASDVNERCGLLMKDETVVEIANIAEDKVAGYEMDPRAVLPLLESGAVVGTWHTHPGETSNLSDADYGAFMAYPDLDHYIIGKDGVTKYQVQNGVLVVCD